ncbi:flavin reductase like domain-containing protein [Colletotrichum truncatum]|uniref:Flavin reductase like domain-containing protein n=1 Tax=Colletotrichum truncatum TaxID=5467 RepID=A0ACC3YM31_COLTU|nr:flavin reductase like domain-containing protein [Colletotrichum truncatum]KAF6791559.1 flavin reductase like domain-containing protein [Colletotrichum truncatum]
MSGARVLANVLCRAGRAKTGGQGAWRAVAGGTQICPSTRSQWLVGRYASSSEPRALHTSTCQRSSAWRTERSQPPSTSLNLQDELPEQLRGVMRRLAHSVVVCTATDRDGQPRGMTMSSFVSLSMDPVPLVTFNVRTPSRTLQAIQDENGLFNIHVLAEGTEGARVAEWFTKGNMGGEVFKNLPGGIEVAEEDGEAPVLEGKGVLFVLKCQVLGEGLVRVRDHVVVVGEVKGVVRGDGQGFGLVYADRRYRTLGDVLVKEN